MGTVARFVVVHEEATRAQEAIDLAMDELRRVERLMTRFDDDSEVGRANRLAATDAVPVGAETALVIQAALGWAEASEGAFDPCIGRAIRLWDIGRRSTPPLEAEVRPLAARAFYRALDLSAWRGRSAVRFTDAGVALDLGGIAKGYGVDRAADAMRRHGVRQAIVSVGGDLYALGGAEDGRPWRVGIRSPDEASRLAGLLEVRDAAVATSGDYLQYFTHRGRRYHHLLDPASAAPRLTPVRSVSVQAPSCLAADAAATTVFGMSPARAERVLRAHAPGARLVSVLSSSG
jgi:thiamine biosynthesis lipoprotein